MQDKDTFSIFDTKTFQTQISLYFLGFRMFWEEKGGAPNIYHMKILITLYRLKKTCIDKK